MKPRLKPRSIAGTPATPARQALPRGGIIVDIACVPFNSARPARPRAFNLPADRENLALTTLLDRFYAALKALSPEGLAACVTEDFVLDWQGTAALPWAGRWQGVQGLLDFVSALNAEIEILQVDRTHLLEAADVTVVVLRGRWRAKRTQREILATAANLFTFAGGRVRTYTVLNNTAAFAEALQGQ